jgi:hypothetical protein
MLVNFLDHSSQEGDAKLDHQSSKRLLAAFLSASGRLAAAAGPVSHPRHSDAHAPAQLSRCSVVLSQTHMSRVQVHLHDRKAIPIVQGSALPSAVPPPLSFLATSTASQASDKLVSVPEARVPACSLSDINVYTWEPSARSETGQAHLAAAEPAGSVAV